MATTTNASENQTLDEMATSYMHASDAAYDTLMCLVDVYGAEDVLKEFFDYMDTDKQIEFVHDFIRYNDVDTSEMNDETLRTINEHYDRHC
jgi:hypothetical protein